MNSPYFYLSRKLIEYSIKQLISGPWGVIISYIIAPFLIPLIKDGVLKIDFSNIKTITDDEKKEFKSVIDELNLVNQTKKELTEQEKNELINKVKQATKRFLSARQSLK